MTPYYSDDLCQLFHGDCRDILPLLDIEGPCSVITDPPYAVDKDGKMLGFVSPNLAEKATHSRGYADHDSKVFHDLIWGFASAAWDLLPEGSLLLAFAGAKTYHQTATAIEDACFRIHDMLIWAHDPGMPKAKTCLAPAHDPAVVASKGTLSVDLRDTPKGWPSNLIRFDRNRETNSHLTPKPVSVMSWCVDMLSEGTVIDPFAGSGTTLRAAKVSGRRSIGIELDEASCEQAASRLAQGTFDLFRA